MLKIFDKSVWFWRRLDVLMPWPGLSLLVVARKEAARKSDKPGQSVRQRRAVSD